MNKNMHSLITYFLVLSVSLASVFPLTVTQSDMAYELSVENETYRILDTFVIHGTTYHIIIYQNDEVILLDDVGNLVLNVNTLKEGYGVKSFKDLFIQNGIVTAKYERIYSALNDLHKNAKLVDDMMTMITLAATVLGISSIVIGGVAIPIVVIVGAIKYATSYIVNNIQQPLNTADDLKKKMATLDTGNLATSSYKEVLSLNVQLRNQLNDLINQLILQITGYGNVVYYTALYQIADVIKVISSDNANKLREYTAGIEKSQKEIENTLTWLNSLNTEAIIQSASTQTDIYISLQNSRISSRKNDFENALQKIQDQLSSAQAEINNYVTQGADISFASSLIAQVDLKIDTARTHASKYEFRTGKSVLAEASVMIQKAKDVASVSLVIHQAELMIDEAQSIINQKAAKGADISQANSKLNMAKTSLQNAKLLLATSPEEARKQANDAIVYAEEAKALAERETIPEQSRQVEPTEQLEPPVKQIIPPDWMGIVVMIVGMILILVIVIAGILYYKKKIALE